MDNKHVEGGALQITLHVPSFEELEFRQKLYSDKQTMNYGDEPFDFCRQLWSGWFDKWVKNPKGRFYAYLIDRKAGVPVGDVNYHFDESFGEFLIGVVILGSKRGKGYAQQGIQLLCQKAKADGLKKVCNLIPRERKDAIHIHKKFGFVEIREKSDESVAFLEKRL